MKWIDIPPIWTAGAVGATYGLGQMLPQVWFVRSGLLSVLGIGLIGLGLLLMVLAVAVMTRHRTTVIPHLQASHLVTSGIFARSRNPIYLGDVLVLGGFVAWSGVWPALPLIAGLVWVLTIRFILPEERRLGSKFGQEFDRYMQSTRRWF